ncbi:MAG: phosphoadenylyl-sulfate reductase, partial [Deltaproteobacteria bacterium]|nr:phosphoadenylyl-sulfate reductase [Deltaproteobacteria bacterium]
LACSFGPEDIVLLDLMHEVAPSLAVFAIDTGRLNEETYDVAQRAADFFGVRIEWYAPDRDAVERLERAKGLYSFRQSLENRHECCGIRKVEPLGRALVGRAAWITGRRQEQSVTRFGLNCVEDDAERPGVLKLNPLAEWTSAMVWTHIRERGLPYNALHDRGFPSIGCAPCTRAVAPGEDERAGRWWWETPENKECGLHVAATTAHASS